LRGAPWAERFNDQPQLIGTNGEATLRRVLGLTDGADVATWMRNNKAEAGLRILDAEESITFPDYIQQAVDLLV
jgi:putative ATP-dependent endonuclease of the OLD family